MVRRFRRLPGFGKIAVLAVGLIVAGIFSGSQAGFGVGSGVAGLGIILLIYAGCVWLLSMIIMVLRRFRGSRFSIPSAALLPASRVDPASWDVPEAWTAARTPSSVIGPTIGDVLDLTPREFEDLTAELLARLGYTGVRRTGGAGDLGADIVCRDPEGRSTIVQCKRFAPGSTVGSKVVQTFIGMQTVHHRAERGMIVTTSGFSQPAARLARQHGIVLVDGPRLLSMLQMTATPVRPVGAVR